MYDYHIIIWLCRCITRSLVSISALWPSAPTPALSWSTCRKHAHAQHIHPGDPFRSHSSYLTAQPLCDACWDAWWWSPHSQGPSLQSLSWSQTCSLHCCTKKKNKSITVTHNDLLGRLQPPAMGRPAVHLPKELGHFLPQLLQINWSCST